MFRPGPACLFCGACGLFSSSHRFWRVNGKFQPCSRGSYGPQRKLSCTSRLMLAEVLQRGRRWPLTGLLLNHMRALTLANAHVHLRVDARDSGLWEADRRSPSLREREVGWSGRGGHWALGGAVHDAGTGGGGAQLRLLRGGSFPVLQGAPRAGGGAALGQAASRVHHPRPLFCWRGGIPLPLPPLPALPAPVPASSSLSLPPGPT